MREQTSLSDSNYCSGNEQVPWTCTGRNKTLPASTSLPFRNNDTNERGLRLLEFATFNDLVLAKTFGHHKASRRCTWHSPNGQHHNQIDYVLMRKRFRSGVNIARTRSFPGADIGNDHDLLMLTFRLHLKKKKKINKDKTHKTQV